MRRYLGVDLHRNCFVVCSIEEGGRSYLRRWKLKELGGFVSELRSTDENAVEVTGNTRLFYDAVVGRVRRVVVVNPSEFKVISQLVNKTDDNDAQRLAFFLWKGLLPEVRMKGKAHAQLVSVAQTRDKLVKLRTALKNKIKNIASAHGINLKKEELSSEKGLEKVLGIRFEPLVKLEVEVLVNQIRSLNKSICELDKAIKDEGSKLKGHKNLKSIKGVGDLGAGILLEDNQTRQQIGSDDFGAMLLNCEAVQFLPQ